jgi:hypothetical protein
MSGTLYASLYVSVVAILFIVASIIGIGQLWRFCVGMLSHYGEYVVERFGHGRNQKTPEGV